MLIADPRARGRLVHCLLDWRVLHCRSSAVPVSNNGPYVNAIIQ